jgi:pimeloyl-ACP methyl ester carboxylesterase
MRLQTSIGAVELDARAADGPLLFVIRGLLPPRDHLSWLREAMPDLDIILVHLPGMHSPTPSVVGARAFADAFEELLARLRSGKRPVVVRVSGGALPAIHMSADALVLIDPFLTPQKNPALHRLLARTNVADKPEVKSYLSKLLGQDYRPLLPRTRMHVVSGGRTDSDNPMFTPSLTTDIDKVAFRKRGAALYTVRDAGHAVTEVAPNSVTKIIRIALERGPDALEGDANPR